MLKDILKLRAANEHSTSSVENVMLDLRVNALFKNTRPERRKSVLLAIPFQNILTLIMLPLVAISHLRSLIVAITSALVCLVIFETVTAWEAVALTFLFWSLLNINDLVNHIVLLVFDLMDFISLGRATEWCLNFYRDLPIELRQSFITSANRTLVNHLFAGRQVWGQANETAWETYFTSLSIEFGHDLDVIQNEVNNYWRDVLDSDRSLLKQRPLDISNPRWWQMEDIWPQMTIPVLIKTLATLDDINELSIGGLGPKRTILGMAVHNGAHIDIVRHILNQGADVNFRQEAVFRGEYPIIACAITGSSNEVVELLLNHGVDIDIASLHSHLTMPQLAAVASKDLETLRTIFRASPANLLISKNKGQSLLHILCEMPQNQTERIKLLIDEGVDINSTNKRGETALITALRGGTAISVGFHDGGPVNIENLRFLIEAGIDIEASDTDGCTAIHALAVDYWSVDDKQALAKILMNVGANVNQQDNSGFTPLHYAALAHSAEMVRCLLSLGADPHKLSMADFKPSSAFFQACQSTLKLEYEEFMPRDYAEIVNLFLEAGCNPHETYNIGVEVTPARLICERLSEYNDGAIKFPDRITEILNPLRP